MKSFTTAFLVIILSFFISQCSTTEKEEPARLSYQKKPTNPTALMQDYFKRNLKDPYSVRDFKILSKTKKGWAMRREVLRRHYDEPMGENNGIPMWYFCAQYNAKNSYGAYTGLQRWNYFVYDGRVVANVQHDSCS